MRFFAEYREIVMKIAMEPPILLTGLQKIAWDSCKCFDFREFLLRSTLHTETKKIRNCTENHFHTCYNGNVKYMPRLEPGLLIYKEGEETTC